MNFICSTKPLMDALNLGIVNSNVSKFYQKSSIAQLTAQGNTLRINLEADSVCSELIVRGSSDSPEQIMMNVDCLQLKQLVATFDANVTTFEFTQDNLILHSGKSTFALSRIGSADAADLELNRPNQDLTGAPVAIEKSDWKFISDYQMYAIAMSFVKPVYNKVWTGNTGDVLVGDYDNSVFTHSKKSKLGKDCLLSDTIINLFTSLPEGATIAESGQSYIINVKTDGFEYVAQFTPAVGDVADSYNAEIIMSVMEKDESKALTVKTAALNKFLNQAQLLATASADNQTITLEVTGNELTLKDSNVNGVITLPETSPTNYSVKFKTKLLQQVISNFDTAEIKICPMIQADVDDMGNEVEITAGVVFWSTSMTSVLSSVDE